MQHFHFRPFNGRSESNSTIWVEICEFAAAFGNLRTPAHHNTVAHDSHDYLQTAPVFAGGNPHRGNPQNYRVLQLGHADVVAQQDFHLTHPRKRWKLRNSKNATDPTIWWQKQWFTKNLNDLCSTKNLNDLCSSGSDMDMINNNDNWEKHVKQPMGKEKHHFSENEQHSCNCQPKKNWNQPNIGLQFRCQEPLTMAIQARTWSWLVMLGQFGSGPWAPNSHGGSWFSTSWLLPGWFSNGVWFQLHHVESFYPKSQVEAQRVTSMTHREISEI